MSRSFAPDFGSAVMPAGRVILDPNWLLDELEIRLTRCDFSGHQHGERSRGVDLAMAEGLFRTADAETSGWWRDHALADVDEQTQRTILSTMLIRSPRQLGWAAVTLLAHHGAHLLDAEMIMRTIRWVTGPETVTRWIRDSVALSLVVPWFERQTEIVVLDTLGALCSSENPAEIRMGLMGGAAYLRKSAAVSASLGQNMLDACRRLADRSDTETAYAVGWVLRELLAKDKARFDRDVMEMAPQLSRQALRIAVERLDWQMRVRIMSEWRKHRQRRNGASS